MPYPTKLLNDDETVAVDLNPHWWYFAEPLASLIGSLVLAILVFALTDGDARRVLSYITLGLIIGTALWVIVRYAKWATTHFVVTNHRVIFRAGIVAKSGIEIPLERVNNVHSQQSVFERVVGAGDLMIESGGMEGQQRFTDIRNPMRVKNSIHEQIVEYKRLVREGDSSGGFAAPPTDVVEQLERLEGMLERGTLTPEEFEAQKHRLLGE